ncbi:hypothetical protein EVAR_48246_1 [Eumeta japonica]|uniref:Uncharacterized protein n=1 Tax=Eumeta variegata TaxID=151549 RepID=A0A4C1YDL7_EUMVA|nr:hypothetical protein EVAR_48246_1 [Eumeta japonica]
MVFVWCPLAVPPALTAAGSGRILLPPVAASTVVRPRSGRPHHRRVPGPLHLHLRLIIIDPFLSLNLVTIFLVNVLLIYEAYPFTLLSFLIEECGPRALLHADARRPSPRRLRPEPTSRVSSLIGRDRGRAGTFRF